MNNENEHKNVKISINKPNTIERKLSNYIIPNVKIYVLILKADILINCTLILVDVLNK